MYERYKIIFVYIRGAFVVAMNEQFKGKACLKQYYVWNYLQL